MTIGVYKLTFSNGSFYVGQSINIESRYVAHCANFKAGKGNKNLVTAYKEYGKPILEILDICDIKELNECEEQLIADLNATMFPGLNILDKVGINCVGEHTSMAKYSDQTYIDILFALQDLTKTQKKVAEELSVSYTVVSSLAHGFTHCWLREKYPTEYDIMLNGRKQNRIYGSAAPKTYRPLLLAPDGTTYDLSGKIVKDFAMEHKLGYSNIMLVLNGGRKTHKGWRLSPSNDKGDEKCL